MPSIQFTILPAPGILKNDVECLRIAEYSGEEGVAIKVSPNETLERTTDRRATLLCSLISSHALSPQQAILKQVLINSCI